MDVVTEQAERVNTVSLEKTTKLQKKEKNREVGSQYNLQQAVRNTASSEYAHSHPRPRQQEGTCLLSRDRCKLSGSVELWR
jgi:hypothetical protein